MCSGLSVQISTMEGLLPAGGGVGFWKESLSTDKYFIRVETDQLETLHHGGDGW